MLNVSSGEILSNHAGDVIRNHCPDFKSITVYNWLGHSSGNADVDSETFLNELRPQSLEYFQILSYSLLGPRSILAISSHLNSWTGLKLMSLEIESISQLTSLAAPPALKVLVLTESYLESQNEGGWDEDFYLVVTELANWIRSCKALRRLELGQFVDDPVLLSHVLIDDSLRLTTLSLEGYNMPDSSTFHEALSCQKSLQNLYLSGKGSFLSEDNEILVQAISQLHDLRELELDGISDCCTFDHLTTLTHHLSHLESLWINVGNFDDDI